MPEHAPSVIAVQDVDAVNTIDGDRTVAICFTTAEGKPFALLLPRRVATCLWEYLDATLASADRTTE